MNNNYKNSKAGIIINVNESNVREYVDNIEDILITENNIENIETKIKMFTDALNRKIAKKKNANLVFGIFVGTTVVGAIIGAFSNIFVSLGVLALGNGLGVLFNKLLADEDVSKKTLEYIDDKILVYQNELKIEEVKLKQLKLDSKKIDIPQDDEVKELPTSYQVQNLKDKLIIVKTFKENPEMFIGAYNSGNLDDIIEQSLSSSNVAECVRLVRFLIFEYRKQQWSEEKENGKNYFKSRR